MVLMMTTALREVLMMTPLSTETLVLLQVQGSLGHFVTHEALAVLQVHRSRPRQRGTPR